MMLFTKLLKFYRRNVVSRSMPEIISHNVVSRSMPEIISQRFNADVSSRRTEEIFFRDDVQELLKKLTRVNLEKVYSTRKQGVRFEPPAYQFMTSAQYQQRREEAVSRAAEKLQMPPVMDPRKQIDSIFVKDENLVGYSKCKIIFTDITSGVNDRVRNIVVRDEDGTLRQANWDERDRINQIYFPRPARKITPSKLFSDQYLKSLLDRGEYIFILDSACCQFEPDDPLYIEVCHQTYTAVNSDSEYNKLRSTRHYGPFVFYLARNKNIDNLLIENIATDRVEDAVWLISLYRILNPDSKVSNISPQHDDQLSFIESYIKEESGNREKLELTLQTYKEYLNTSQNQQQNVNI